MPESLSAPRVHATVASPLGELTLVREGARVTGLYFAQHWYRPPPSSLGPRVGHGFGVVMSQLAEYFAGQRQEFDLAPLLAGTDEQLAAWRLVARIPYGETTTYGALARELGSGIDARDAGKLIGRNPLCILVPCHRVIGASGHLTGYAGGVARKRALLELERALPVAAHQLSLAFGEAADIRDELLPRLAGRSGRRAG
jgi:methylated-DNA-[protein]-cysteine S-methyltransferase